MLSLLLTIGLVEANTLESNTQLSRDGTFILSWSMLQGGNYELQQAFDHEFTHSKSWHINSHRSFSHSGLINGTYYFRVRTPKGPWSNTIQITVKHHNLTRAWAFFLAGLLLFIVLIHIIFKSAHHVNLK